MQPSPRAETSNPLLPNLRFSISSPSIRVSEFRLNVSTRSRRNDNPQAYWAAGKAAPFLTWNTCLRAVITVDAQGSWQISLHARRFVADPQVRVCVPADKRDPGGSRLDAGGGSCWRASG